MRLFILGYFLNVRPAALTSPSEAIFILFQEMKRAIKSRRIQDEAFEINNLEFQVTKYIFKFKYLRRTLK